MLRVMKKKKKADEIKALKFNWEKNIKINGKKLKKKKKL